ncbi:MAG: amidohydrolase family protein [Betaproteobacteria bacterium]
MQANERPSFIHPSPSRPALALPHGACDAHVHVFGPMVRFPFAADAPFTPGDASKERLFALHALLGIERCVVVQSTCHGYDNSVSADAVVARASTYCGIALAPVSVTDATLRALNAQGFRGLRFNFMKHLGDATPIADVIALTSRLAALNMHLQVHFESAMVDDLAPWLLRSATPVVIDHMGRVDAALGVGQPHFRSLCRLLEDDRMWIKVSGSDRITATGAPYADAVPFARMLVRNFGDRTLWGSDWPHPNSRAIPDDGALVDLLSQIAPSATQLKGLLVDNPQRLYRFPMALPPPSGSGSALSFR